jgi:hypothetical protein
MSTQLALDLSEVAHRQRLRTPHTSREVRRLERHLKKVARRIDLAESARRRQARERELERTAQLLVFANWRQV